MQGRGPERLQLLCLHHAPAIIWHRLLSVIGREDLVDDPHFAGNPDRARHTLEVDAIIVDWTRSRTKVEVMDAEPDIHRDWY